MVESRKSSSDTSVKFVTEEKKHLQVSSVLDVNEFPPLPELKNASSEKKLHFLPPVVESRKSSLETSVKLVTEEKKYLQVSTVLDLNEFPPLPELKKNPLFTLKPRKKKEHAVKKCAESLDIKDNDKSELNQQSSEEKAVIHDNDEAICSSEIKDHCSKKRAVDALSIEDKSIWLENDDKSSKDDCMNDYHFEVETCDEGLPNIGDSKNKDELEFITSDEIEEISPIKFDDHINGRLSNRFEENKKSKSQQEGVDEVKNDRAVESYLKKNVEDKEVKDNLVRKSSRFKYQQNQYSSKNKLCPHILPMIDDHLPFSPKINVNGKKIVRKPFHQNEKYVK